jgi:hypothetical protein
MDYIFLFKWLLAVSPIAVVLVLMIGFNWGVVSIIFRFYI